MSWDALGAMAEAVGAFAVVVTLLFLLRQQRQLAAQLQQSSLALELSSYRDRAGQLSGLLLSIGLDGDAARVLHAALQARGYQDESLSSVDWLRFSLIARSVFAMHEDLFYQHRSGAIDATFWAHRRDWLKQLVAQIPAYCGWWEQERASGAYVQDFISAIDETQPAIPGEHLQGRTA